MGLGLLLLRRYSTTLVETQVWGKNLYLRYKSTNMLYIYMWVHKHDHR